MLKSVIPQAPMQSQGSMPDQGLRENTEHAGVIFMDSKALWKAAVGKTRGEQGGEQVLPGARA